VNAPIWIEASEAVALHERLLAIDGGAAGIRDRALLESPLARPRQRVAVAERASIVELAAAYTAGVVKNHPFIDGNKRTGFVVGILFLELNGFRFAASEEAAAEAVIALAAGELDEDGYAMFLANNLKRSGNP
jgi:death on curing protein